MSSPSNSGTSVAATGYQTSSLDSGTLAPSEHEASSSPLPQLSSSSMPSEHEASSSPLPQLSSSMLSSTSSSSSSSHRQRGLLNFLAASSSSSPPTAPARMVEDKRRKVVAIKSVSASNDDFYQDKFLSGDIVQRVGRSDDDYFASPFPAGKRGLMEELHNFHRSGVSILTIHVRRSERMIVRRALIVPNKKRKYVLQDFDDPSHVFTIDDLTLEACATMQDQSLKDAQEHLSKLRVAAIDVDYPWEKVTQSENGSGMIHSLLLVPHVNADVGMENTVRQALTWLHESKMSGIPLMFRSIQTEPIITEASEQSLNVNISHAVSSTTYSLAQSQGDADRFVVMKAIRIWFAFCAPEIEVQLEAMQGESLLGINIARTAEGFCYVTEVVPDTAAYRAGLKECLDAAQDLGMKLVVTKVGNERVLPWLVSRGSIRCYEINSISSKLSAFRRAGKPACLHLLDMTCSTFPQAPGSISTSSFGVDESASTVMEF